MHGLSHDLVLPHYFHSHILGKSCTRGDRSGHRAKTTLYTAPQHPISAYLWVYFQYDQQRLK